MIRYYADAHGRPFVGVYSPSQYFAWDEDKSIGYWVSATNGHHVSESGFTPNMSIVRRWMIVEPFHPPYLELDEGL